MMSFDIAVLSLEKKVTNAEATDIYAELNEGNYSRIAPNDAINRIYHEVTAKHPEIDDVPDDKIDDLDFCPWSCDIDKSDGHLIISTVWPKSDYAHKLVQEIATKHQLPTFDPQNGVITYPDGSSGIESEKKKWWQFW